MNEISVIIPTWNRADTIERAVRSALAQDLPPLEVLVCDDGSTDDTEQIVAGIGDRRVKWLSGQRGGRPALPRNRGIRESNGEWLAFLDSDDEWLPNKLGMQLTLVQHLRCKAACSNATRYVPGKGFTGNYLLWEDEKITFDNLLRANPVICSSVLIHRSLFATAVGFPEDDHLKAVEDYALWLRIATQTDFAYHRGTLLVYRDDTVHSIRNEGTTPQQQRKAVFNDFLNWKKDQSVPFRFIRKVLQQMAMDTVCRTVLRTNKACTGKCFNY